MGNASLIRPDGFYRVEVAYALPERQLIVAVDVPPQTTAVEAIRLSGIEEQFAEIDLQTNRIGVFGKLCKPDRVLAPGERVEIYRPLKADPKAVRRERAAQANSAPKS
jgi:putative ubiquitin-RnfH superfamily antitoxin RatB of RatAB toxin-antitoxin module